MALCPFEVYQDGLLGHVVGLLRAQLPVPHLDSEGERAGGTKVNAMSLKSVLIKIGTMKSGIVMDN
eukprot:11732629-Prorocentrum_lima.AAC.1